MESQPQNPESGIILNIFTHGYRVTCADPESFVRGGPNWITFFSVDKR